MFAGDVRKDAERAFFKLVQTRYPEVAERRIDVEPFEVIRDMLRAAGPHDSIGGAPQLAKVNQYMYATTVAVYWPNASSGIPVLQGRPVLRYEKVDRWILDPDTLWLSHQWLSEGNGSDGYSPSIDGIEASDGLDGSDETEWK